MRRCRWCSAELKSSAGDDMLVGEERRSESGHCTLLTLRVVFCPL
jgi:hypothetical protein